MKQILGVLLGCLLPLAVAQVSHRRGPIHMTSTSTELSADLVPQIGAPGVVIAVLRVQSGHWTPVAGTEYEEGDLSFEVVQVLQPAETPVNGAFRCQGRRLTDPDARRMSGFDQWNVVDFSPGKELLAAVIAATKTLVAAEVVESVHDPEVRAVEACVQIARLPLGSLEQVKRLQEALEGTRSFSRRFASEWLVNRSEISREQGATMLADAIGAAGTSPEARAELASAITNRKFYKYELGADAVNATAVRALANGLLRESEPKRQVLWTRYLASNLMLSFSPDPAKDKELRSALLRSVTAQPAPIVAVLQKVAGQQANDPRIPRLIQAWTAAVR